MKTSQELFTLNRIVLRALIHPFSFQNDKFLLLIQENIYGVIILNQIYTFPVYMFRIITLVTKIIKVCYLLDINC